jgi:hypothetical protein
MKLVPWQSDAAILGRPDYDWNRDVMRSQAHEDDAERAVRAALELHPEKTRIV